ncbi:MAG: aminoglycoside phosphotransferase family protein [Bacillota bacterium]|nr:aminoglycoside phosphotransferase family protein [Bacillota bacterium]
MVECLSEILSEFDLKAKAKPFGDGHINDTYVIESPPYVLQRINTEVFKNPDNLMENIVSVTRYLRDYIKKEGGDPDRETLTVIMTKGDKSYYQASNGKYYRIYKLIQKAKTYNQVETLDQFYNAAKAFGKFQNMLSDFPAESLYETIPDFHNTSKRYDNLEKAISDDLSGRAKDVEKEIEFALSMKKYASSVTDAIAEGTIPVRVTHNDTKLNNVMLDDTTGEGVCVIDLDTVMPGSLLYDYGDALRFGASSAAEDETDLSKVYFDMELFESFTKGYLEETGNILTEKERELLPLSALLLTLECGTRFLADHLNGDTYFKIHRPGHNLDRARNQFKLVSDIESKLPEMKKVVDKYLK